MVDKTVVDELRFPCRTFATEEDYKNIMARVEERERLRKERAHQERERVAARKNARPQFREICEVSARAIKTHIDDPYYDDSDHPKPATKWATESIALAKMTYVGFRYVKNGGLRPELDSWDAPGEGYYFDATKTMEVWLFIPNERQNMIRAFPADVQKLETEEKRDDK
ncbi:hypothetical protein LCGC14_3059230 [marine sediment metagenome]|uniref:Uncharacterized protein n=1 Tax=marine sediment metagenome TaxID=412755 RepID=A0A0F8ZA76_9ZZZZ